MVYEKPMAHVPAPRHPRLTWKERAMAEPDAVDGRIVDPHVPPPTDGNGWPLWLPGNPA